MPSSVTSLFWISVCAAAAPLIAGLIPRRLVPEVVLLLVGGTLIGPYVFDLAASDEAIGMLHELGLGMLFLLAGYEIDLKELTGRDGRRALATWVVCLLLAFTTIWLIGLTEVIDGETAVAIALTSTALGTLLPILKDGGLLTTPVGRIVMRHGAFGELGPIVAIAVLLGVHGPIESLLFLAAFAVIAALSTLPSLSLSRETSRLIELIRAGSETTGQTAVRLTILLLVTLVAVAAAFQLDAVLGAFAAGFVLRHALPEGDENLESRVEGIAFGLLIPVFFVTSGMAIDPGAIADEPYSFVIFIVLILLVRGGPVLVSTMFTPTSVGPPLDMRSSVEVALYAATGLPVIVAVTAVAVEDGQMSTTNASVLVAGGAMTVLIFPMLATLMAEKRRAAHPEAVLEEPDSSS